MRGMPGYTSIRFDVDDAGIATITFNRPDHFNGIDLTMAAELTHALARSADRPDVRVLVLTGAGRSFCPGADVMSVSAEAGPAPSVSPLASDISLPVRLHEFPLPTIAAINGACAGAGFGFACACDLRIAARSAVFRSAFLGVGVAGDMGVPWSLPRLVGEATAKQISFLDDKFDAEQARQYGLVLSVHDDADFPAAVAQVARRLAAGPPLAMRALKQHYLAAKRVDFPAFIDLEFQRHHHLLATADAREGFAAFSQRREPRFTGQ
jgi:2-(1,2-epoxy-1,2-dihydrophenyl)acetyl-CoA isomerase